MRRLPVPQAVRSFPFAAGNVPVGVDVLPTKARMGAEYDSSWARQQPARYARFFIVEGPMRAAMAAVASPTRTGLDRLAGLEGPAIFAANHHSHLDAPLMMTSIPQRFRHRLVVAAAADYFFANQVTAALSALAMGAFPIERSRVSRDSADQAAALVSSGWSLLIFPEGGRSPDGWGQGHRGGAAFLAVRTGAPVVPVHIAGTDRISPRGSKKVTPGRTTITFGNALRPAPGDDARRFASTIEAAVARLADESTTDWWSARRRAASGETPSLTGPASTGWRRAWALGDRTGRTRAAKRRWPEL